MDIKQQQKKHTLNGRKLRDCRGEVLFVDLRRWDAQIAEYVIEKGKSKRKVVFTQEQIDKIKAIYHSWQTVDYKDIPKLCKSVKKEEIKKQGYILAPSKYIEFIDHDLQIDYTTEMERNQSREAEVVTAEKKRQKLLEESFKGIGFALKGDIVES